MTAEAGAAHMGPGGTAGRCGEPDQAFPNGEPDLGRSGGRVGGHDHGVPHDADKKRLIAVATLTVAFIGVEIAASVQSGSLALLSDAGHMLADAGALAGALWAMHLASKPASDRWSFGLKRAEILSAAVNGVILVAVAAVLAYQAVGRLLHPPVVAGLPMVVVACIGGGVNLFAAFLLSHNHRDSLNMRGVFAHVIADLYAFAGTVVAGAAIMAFGYYRADPIATIVVVGLMSKSAWRLLAASGRVLLQGTPESVDLEQVRSHLGGVQGVLGVHEVHAWTLTSALPVLSAHVIVSDELLTSGEAGMVLDRLQECLAGHFDVEHSTFQLEPATHVDHERPEHP